MKFRSKEERLAERDRRNAELKAKTAAKLQAIDEKHAERTAKREAEYAERSAELKAEMRAGVEKMKDGVDKIRGARRHR